MAIATGAWGNSSESCEDKWDDYVKKKKHTWTVCNEFNHSGFLSQCHDAEVLTIPAIYDLKRKEYIDECSRNPDYPEILDHFYPSARKSRAKSRQNKHHYIFDVNHKGVDFSGFVVHTANKHHYGHRLKVYLDTNDNGRFDKKDELIGTSKLKNKHSKNGIGGILDSGEIGSVEVKFKRKPSMRTDDSSASLVGEGAVTRVDSAATGVGSMSSAMFGSDGEQPIVSGISFYAADESIVSNIIPVGILENFGV